MRGHRSHPILPVIPYDGIEQALDFVRDRPRPLALYLFSYDQILQDRVMTRTHAGSMCINEALIQVGVDDLAFGGIGPSGATRRRRKPRARENLKISQTKYWSISMANGWTSERRARQSALIRNWKPWEQSTGPKSEEGKARVSRNAFKPRRGARDSRPLDGRRRVIERRHARAIATWCA